MRLRFTKMHGLGNDFVMVDAISQRVAITPERARQLADRHFGVGCDQVLVVEAPQNPDADFSYRIFNHDGSEVENCGNGARCFAIFVRQRHLTTKTIINAETRGGMLQLHVHPDDSVTVDMGAPRLTPAEIPFVAPSEAPSYRLQLNQQELEIGAVSMGNPHAVTLVDNLDAYPVAEVGAEVECHSRFPNRVNAGFMQIINRNQIHLRVFERGVGETIACGTGACAAMVSGVQRGLLDNQVSVNLPGGQLQIEWDGPGKPVKMTGPATTVFHGQIKI
ncbi:diaminopimelate epimerase [Teredinibacter waterburyi]|jgi:diaminopimelate epimerase (EC 5.1.1.7)|uniref:diaminopimelate epimerase n=1 Tax=Teredinibacter waterburyi TaxID=1500538 RepID=UPI00165F8986|nr:diaminopimelate epimerase [Teredinibacter waterburyi]